MKSITKGSFCRGALLLTPLALAVSSAMAVPVPGGTLDPLSIPKYVEPLLIPPVMPPSANADYDYEIALRQFTQQRLPTTGCLTPASCGPNGEFPATTLWGYGDPNNPATFNNPSLTVEVNVNQLTRVKWSNELVVDPANCKNKKVKHNGQGGPACDFLTHVIKDSLGNPVIDQTLHWTNPAQDCRDGIPRTDCAGASAAPYLGPITMVSHLHGAHVGPVSDGYPEAWWLPAAGNVPKTYASSGTFFDDMSAKNKGDTGYAVYEYTNDQPSSTLWYHDHSLGITRLNVYAAAAGFWLIRDPAGGESGLVSGTLPGSAPVLGEDPNGDGVVRTKIREIPIAIQGQSFNIDGSLYYPADRQFFEGLGAGNEFALNAEMLSDVTLDGKFPFLPQATSDIAPVWNPEAFFNTMVVNGSTWPQLDVASERYRFRLLNATDSRFLNLALFQVTGPGDDGVMGTADDVLGAEIPFYQIGSEQGLLPNVVRIETGFATPLPGDGTDVGTGVLPVPGANPQQALLMGPAERHDVIVDFGGLDNGTIVRMVNTAPDAPFGGFPDVPADPGTTGQVMQFMVDIGLNRDSDKSTAPADLVLDPNPGGAPKLGVSDVTRDLALLEEESALLCVEVDAVSGDIKHVAGDPLVDCPTNSEHFAPMAAVLGVGGRDGSSAQLWDDPISTNPALNAVETWELWNHSADAHPIHLHLVKFEVVNREVIGGAVRAPEPWEAGWKDTVIAYPGEVTRVKALFDKAGLYVWHCHILSHEDNEMMVPYCVGTPGVDCPEELF